MGEVYRAHDLRLGRDVALKTLPANFAADADRVARFERVKLLPVEGGASRRLPGLSGAWAVVGWIAPGWPRRD